MFLNHLFNHHSQFFLVALVSSSYALDKSVFILTVIILGEEIKYRQDHKYH